MIGVLGGTESLTVISPAASIVGEAAPEVSSTHENNGGQRIDIRWLSVVIVAFDVHFGSIII